MAMPAVSRGRKWTFRYGYKYMLTPLLVIAILLLVLLLVVAIYRASNHAGHGHHRLPPVESAQVLDHQKQQEAKGSKLRRLEELWRRLVYKIKAAGAVLTGSEQPSPPQKGPKTKGKSHTHVLNKKSGNNTNRTTRRADLTPNSVARATRTPQPGSTKKASKKSKAKRELSTKERSKPTRRTHFKRKKRPTKATSTSTTRKSSTFETVKRQISKAFTSTGPSLAQSSAPTPAASSTDTAYRTSVLSKGGSTATEAMPSLSSVSAAVPIFTTARVSSQAETTKAHVTLGTSSSSNSLAITSISKGERISVKASTTEQDIADTASTLSTRNSSSPLERVSTIADTTTSDVTHATPTIPNDSTTLGTSRTRLLSAEADTTEPHSTHVPSTPSKATAAVGTFTTEPLSGRSDITPPHVSQTGPHASSTLISSIPGISSATTKPTTGLTSPSSSPHPSNTQLAGNLSSPDKTVRTANGRKSSTALPLPSAGGASGFTAYSPSERREPPLSRAVDYSSISSNRTEGHTATSQSNARNNTVPTFQHADAVTTPYSLSISNLNESSSFSSSVAIAGHSTMKNNTVPVSHHSGTTLGAYTSSNTIESSLFTLPSESVISQNYTALPITSTVASALMDGTKSRSTRSPKSTASLVVLTSGSTAPPTVTNQLQLPSNAISDVLAATNTSRASENCCSSSTEGTTQLLSGIFGDAPFQVDGFRFVGSRSPDAGTRPVLEIHSDGQNSARNGSLNSVGTEASPEGLDRGHLQKFHLKDELDRMAEMYGKYVAVRHNRMPAERRAPAVQGLPDFVSVWQDMSLGRGPSNFSLQTENVSDAVAFIPGLEVTTAKAALDRQARFQRLRELLLSEDTKVPDLRKLAILEELEEKNEAQS